jgi:hypothetical protein
MIISQPMFDCGLVLVIIEVRKRQGTEPILVFLNRDLSLPYGFRDSGPGRTGEICRCQRWFSR